MHDVQNTRIDRKYVENARNWINNFQLINND